MTYAATQREILAVGPRSDRHRELLAARSDDLLERLETLNLARYGAVRNPTTEDLHAVRLTNTLARAVNDLLVEMGLSARRLTTTRDALDAVYDAQSIIFGVPDEQQEELFG